MTQEIVDFLKSQLAYYEPGVYMRQYPEVQYRSLMPIETNAPEWTQNIVHYTSDGAGEVNWQSPQATDVPVVDVTRSAHSITVNMAAIGYRWNYPELLAAMQVGANLDAERAYFCREIVERTIDNVALRGDPELGWDGLINLPTRAPSQTSAIAAGGTVVRIEAGTLADGTTPLSKIGTAANAHRNRYWETLLADEVIADFNKLADRYLDWLVARRDGRHGLLARHGAGDAGHPAHPRHRDVDHAVPAREQRLHDPHGYAAEHHHDPRSGERRDCGIDRWCWGCASNEWPGDCLSPSARGAALPLPVPAFASCPRSRYQTGSGR